MANLGPGPRCHRTDRSGREDVVLHRSARDCGAFSKTVTTLAGGSPFATKLVPVSRGHPRRAVGACRAPVAVVIVVAD